jgi:hypothetical protein
MNKQVPNAFNSISTSSVDWKARNEQAQKIREMQVIYKIKKTLAQSVKWNVVRKKRQELEAKYFLTVEKIQRANFWVRLIL